MSYRKEGNKYIFTLPDGQETVADFSGIDGLKTDNLFRRGSKDQFAQYVNYFLETGEMPSEQWVKERFGSTGSMQNFAKDLQTVLQKQGLNIDSYRTQFKAHFDNQQVDNQYIWDESRLKEQGTKENDVYDFYLNKGRAEGEINQNVLARSERDMQIEMAGQRSQLLDEIRKRRQNQLRSGLSSAQIANEEIQMLLMGQQAQQQTAQSYYDQYLQSVQAKQMNPYNAELAARQHIGGSNQAMAPSYAAFTADPYGQAIQRGNLSPTQQKYQDWLTDTNKK